MNMIKLQDTTNQHLKYKWIVFQLSFATILRLLLRVIWASTCCTRAASWLLFFCNRTMFLIISMLFVLMCTSTEEVSSDFQVFSMICSHWLMGRIVPYNAYLETSEQYLEILNVCFAQTSVYAYIYIHTYIHIIYIYIHNDVHGRCVQIPISVQQQKT